MVHYFRSHLGWKLFISYLLVVAVVVVISALTAQFRIESAFEQHMGAMSRMGTAMMGETMIGNSLLVGFSSAINDVMLLAMFAGGLVALLLSVWIARAIVKPIIALTGASDRIAAGKYTERIDQLHSFDEIGQLGKSINQLAQNLDQAEELRRRLIADITHELRTPLTTIKGSLEGLVDGVFQPNLETYQQLYQEADRLQSLVDDLQELSRVEAGVFELDLEQTPVTRLVETVVERLGQQYAEKGVSLDVDMTADLPEVWIDQNRINQVLLNLVGNALQYTPPDGNVHIQACREKNEVRLIVVDNGIGIAAEHLPHIFTRFYRVDKSRSRPHGGSGIGLTIAKYLVEANAGRIWAESEGIGKGSRFIISLPTKTGRNNSRYIV